MWTNPYPASSFSPQNVSLGNSDIRLEYSYIKVVYKTKRNLNDEKECIIKIVNQSSDANRYGIVTEYIDSPSSSCAVCRPFDIRGDGKYIYFTYAYLIDLANSTNDYCIPTEIYGVNIS